MNSTPNRRFGTRRFWAIAVVLAGLVGLAALAQPSASAQDCGQQPTCTAPNAQIRITNAAHVAAFFTVEGLNGLTQERTIAPGAHEVVGYAAPGARVEVTLNDIPGTGPDDYLAFTVPGNATSSTYVEFTADSTPQGQWGMSVEQGTDPGINPPRA